MGTIFFRQRSRPWRWAGYALAFVSIAGALAYAGLRALGWWVDFSDEPFKADALVVLAGGYSRPFHGADLFKQGLAPEVWLCRPKAPPAEDLIRKAGLPFPREEDVNRDILLKAGVPAAKVRFYGREVMSTADEALSFASEFDARGKKVLIVTSRFHARRAKMIFRRHLEGAEVRVTATGYEPMPARWWRDKFMAQFVVLEALKTLYYLLGGRFLGATRVA
ncbi:MAG: YdcF family protein [Elusimicrobia bacterium]|nr:YdcF family protein [Elusimicrobiota bacterium]